MNELAGSTYMIFTRTCDNTRKLALMLRNLGFDALPIHGQMSQPKRLGALNKFKAGERSILVATGKALSVEHVLVIVSPLDSPVVSVEAGKEVGILELDI